MIPILLLGAMLLLFFTPGDTKADCIHSKRCTPTPTRTNTSIPTNTPASTPTLTPTPTTSGMTLVFSDEFDGATLDTSKWATCLYSRGAPDGSQCVGFSGESEYYLARNVSVSDGLLHLTAHKESGVGYYGEVYNYTSGVVTTGRIYAGTNHFQFGCGYAEARIKVPSGLGTWPAFWTLEQYGEAVSPLQEDDILEYLGRTPDIAYQSEHAPDSGTGVIPDPNAESEFHVYAANWQLGRVTWYIDGVQTRQFIDSNITCDNEFVLLNLALGGWGGAIDDSIFPVEMLVDYVRIYQ